MTPTPLLPRKLNVAGSRRRTKFWGEENQVSKRFEFNIYVSTSAIQRVLSQLSGSSEKSRISRADLR